MSTEELWRAISHEAQEAQRTTHWPELLENIRLACALIDQRISAFQRKMRTEQLLAKQKNNLGRQTEELDQRGGEKHGMAADEVPD
jgi:hypothetical protein